MSGHTDIQADGWVARLPDGIKPYALLARLDRPIGAWLLFLPGAWSIALTARGAQLSLLLGLFGCGSVLMRSAGCIVNDMWDRDLDRRVTRTAGRPLASGALGMRQATAMLAVLLCLALLILLRLDALARWLGAASLVLVALYPAAKRFTWWPQLLLGCTFGWGVLLGCAAGTPPGGHLTRAAWALYAAAIVWIVGYDTIYAHQDREDDALIGVRSTARLFAAHTRPFLVACYGATVALLALAGALAGLSAAFYGLLGVVAVLLGLQILRLDVNDPALCLRLFRSNREVGLLVAVAVLAGRL